MRLAISLLLVFAVSIPVQAQEANPDPWENMNRRLHKLNDFADRVVLKPAATGYKKVMPGPAYRAVGNVYDNIRDVNDGFNNLLQGNIHAGVSDFLRVVINTTLGVGGLFDPATKFGLEDHNEDFGQTLAKWGVPPEPYVVIPFIGPATVRDVLSRPIYTSADAVRYLQPVSHRNTVYGMRLIHVRSELFAAESVIFGDRYIFIRDAYLQRREFLTNDGEVDDPFGDDF